MCVIAVGLQSTQDSSGVGKHPASCKPYVLWGSRHGSILGRRKRALSTDSCLHSHSLPACSISTACYCSQPAGEVAESGNRPRIRGGDRTAAAWELDQSVRSPRAPRRFRVAVGPRFNEFRSCGLCHDQYQSPLRFKPWISGGGKLEPDAAAGSACVSTGRARFKVLDNRQASVIYN